eukprot:228269-Hanusia_phi.AAC.1
MAVPCGGKLTPNGAAINSRTLPRRLSSNGAGDGPGVMRPRRRMWQRRAPRSSEQCGRAAGWDGPPCSLRAAPTQFADRTVSEPELTEVTGFSIAVSQFCQFFCRC